MPCSSLRLRAVPKERLAQASRRLATCRTFFASGPFRGGYRLPRKLARSIQLAVIRCSVRLVVKQLRFFARPIRRPADLFRHARVITLQERKLIQRVADAG